MTLNKGSRTISQPGGGLVTTILNDGTVLIHQAGSLIFKFVNQ